MFSAGRVGVARRGRCVFGAGEAEGSGLRLPDCALSGSNGAHAKKRATRMKNATLRRRTDDARALWT
jgi:hypothetical protein